MEAALDLLRRCATPAGFIAAVPERDNYRHVWARDGVICGLAGRAAGDDGMGDALARTLRTLAKRQGPSGQLPSNVDPVSGRVSYGGKAGRVDATLWWLVGVHEAGLADELSACVERARGVLRAWELNDRGLLYVPRAGDWADEYVLSGYLLYDQALRVWVRRAAGRTEDAETLSAMIESSFWPRGDGKSYDERLLAPHADPNRRHPLAGFDPGRVHSQFDAFGTALCCLLGIGRADRLLDHAERLLRFDLVPAFDPVITPGDPDWRLLEGAAAGGSMRNTPGRYHNGGLWPMINGFWAMAAARHGRSELAKRLRRGIRRANALDGGSFPEYVDAETGQAGGTRQQAWSAAGEVLATAGDELIRWGGG